mmetsp:Transcript_59521/g.142911  ORF Transcript_59521/g.142911 Transcript_59521/m.142911 type:complete len:257 (-) Transcript_59521:130-900(-)
MGAGGVVRRPRGVARAAVPGGDQLARAAVDDRAGAALAPRERDARLARAHGWLAEGRRHQVVHDALAARGAHVPRLRTAPGRLPHGRRLRRLGHGRARGGPAAAAGLTRRDQRRGQAPLAQPVRAQGRPAAALPRGGLQLAARRRDGHPRRHPARLDHPVRRLVGVGARTLLDHRGAAAAAPALDALPVALPAPQGQGDARGRAAAGPIAESEQAQDPRRAVGEGPPEARAWLRHPRAARPRRRPDRRRAARARPG